jgi:hypothetical protein
MLKSEMISIQQWCAEVQPGQPAECGLIVLSSYRMHRLSQVHPKKYLEGHIHISNGRVNHRNLKIYINIHVFEHKLSILVWQFHGSGSEDYDYLGCNAV